MIITMRIRPSTIPIGLQAQINRIENKSRGHGETSSNLDLWGGFRIEAGESRKIGRPRNRD